MKLLILPIYTAESSHKKQAFYCERRSLDYIWTFSAFLCLFYLAFISVRAEALSEWVCGCRKFFLCFLCPLIFRTSTLKGPWMALNTYCFFPFLVTEKNKALLFCILFVSEKATKYSPMTELVFNSFMFKILVLRLSYKEEFERGTQLIPGKLLLLLVDKSWIFFFYIVEHLKSKNMPWKLRRQQWKKINLKDKSASETDTIPQSDKGVIRFAAVLIGMICIHFISK